MKKRLAPMVLTLLLLLSLSVNAFAATQSTSIFPTLTFSGTTATCGLRITASGEEIEATLELWHGNTLIASWTASGTGYVVISETHSAVSGQTYTLKAYGEIGGVEFESTPVSKRC